MAQTKQTKAQKQSELRRDALLLFKVANDQTVSEHARHDIAERLDEVCNSSLIFDPMRNKAHFLKTFLDGWQHADYSRRNVQTILNQLKAGKSADEIVAWFDERRAQHHAKMQAEENKQPEPCKKLSNKWRYWKIRQLTRSLTGDDSEKYQSAWVEFRALVDGLTSDPSFWHVSNALALLPHLLIARQVIDENAQAETRSKAKAKAQKGGTR